MKELFNIKYRLRGHGDWIYSKNAKLDECYRNIKDLKGNPLHSAKGRLTIPQATERANKRGIEIQYIYDCIKHSYLYGSNGKDESAHLPKETPKEPIKTESAPTSKSEETPKEQPKKNTEESKPRKPNLDGLGVFADMLKPYLDLVEINQEKVNQMITESLKKHVKIIEIKQSNGEIKKIGFQHYIFEDLLTFVQLRQNILLVGPAGSGKTQAAENVAHALELPFYAISVGMMTTKTDFLGYCDANGNYVKTHFRQAYEHGGVFLLDELDAGNANVITTINMALSNNVAAFPDKMVQKHKDFVLIAGANTFGNGSNREYVGRNQLDAATLNRFNVIEMNYDENLENAITQAINPRWTKFVQKCRFNADRLKIRVVISPRQSISGGQLLNAGMTFEKVCNYVLFKGLNESERGKLTQNIVY